MIQTILYIAISLEGFIAKPDGNLEWLTSFPTPSNGDDYGYSELLKNIETTIMGRKTYEEVLNFGIEWPYKGLHSYIVSSNQNLEIKSPDTYLLNQNISDFITKLKNKSKKNIWIIGGGQLVTNFLKLELIDKMILTIIPKILGDGIPLFFNNGHESAWKLNENKSFNTGVVQLTFEKLVI